MKKIFFIIIFLIIGLTQKTFAYSSDPKQFVSEVVNEAVRIALLEDQEDLSAFEERANEPTLSYEDLLEDLKSHGKL